MKYNNFMDKSVSELEALMRNSEKLNFEAKLSLRRSLQSANINIEAALENEIIEEENRIADLQYIRNLGYSIRGSISDDSFVIRRSNWTIFIDWFSLFVGARLIFLLPKAWETVLSFSQNGVDPLGLIKFVFLLGGGLLGLGLFYRSFLRLLELNGFRISKDPSGFQIKKREIGTIESNIAESEFKVVRKEPYSILTYLGQSDNEIELIKTKGGVRHQRTLKHLGDILNK